MLHDCCLNVASLALIMRCLMQIKLHLSLYSKLLHLNLARLEQLLKAVLRVCRMAI